MATEEYVPVTADDWYQRRRDDAEGRFFRRVADQGPRKGEGGSTRQGIYCLTADGQLLVYKNAGQNPEVMREALRQGLREWRKLPPQRRQPGAVQVGEPDQIDPRYTRTPPRGGLIVNVFTRILDHQDGELCRGTCRTLGGNQAARDHLWLTEAEWQSLVPADPRPGNGFPLPAAIAERLLRFHLVDNTRGEPPMWRREDIRSQLMMLTVEEATAAVVRLRLDGFALLATHPDDAQADRGFDVRLLGYIGYDRTRKMINRFEVVAVGDHWGEGPFTRGARPGRTPLGIAFELADGKSAADRVPPQAARDLRSYFGHDR
ncbi:MAG TPA: hypothetical protein VNK04_14050 [Gemmataceae bacterium]|nr:hypothetical protein [Gemmataceae bacterium]